VIRPLSVNCFCCRDIASVRVERQLIKTTLGSYVKTKSSHGSHDEFPISAKNNNIVYDHPMNISAKFGSNLFCGFRKKDENVKFP
jgi:hypothetical protein